MTLTSTAWANFLAVALLGVIGDDTVYKGDDTVATGDDTKFNQQQPVSTAWTQIT